MERALSSTALLGTAALTLTASSSLLLVLTALALACVALVSTLTTLTPTATALCGVLGGMISILTGVVMAWGAPVSDEEVGE